MRAKELWGHIELVLETCTPTTSFLTSLCILTGPAERANYLLGTPETRRSGRRTRKARNAFTSNPSNFIVDRTVLTTLKKHRSAYQIMKILLNRTSESLFHHQITLVLVLK